MASCGNKTEQRGYGRINAHALIYKTLIYEYFFLCILHATYLYTLDLGATHAATAIDKEQNFSAGFLQLQWFRQQVGTEVEHQDGVT